MHATDFLGEARAWQRLTHEDRSALFALILYAMNEPGAVLPEGDVPSLTGLTPAQWKATASRLSPSFITVGGGGLVAVVRMLASYSKVIAYRKRQREASAGANKKRWTRLNNPDKDPPRGDARGDPHLERNGTETEGFEEPPSERATEGRCDIEDCGREATAAIEGVMVCAKHGGSRE